MKNYLKILAALLLLISTSSFADTKLYKGSAIVVVRADKIDDFKKAVAKILEITRKEPGNISYEAFQILDEGGTPTNRFEFREQWISKDALDRQHMKSQHMKSFFKEVKAQSQDSFLESLEISGEWVNKI
ncbi:antibiotic biosynthesis monooxygenase [Oligoflexaceae bacterium]|nr:antibiotic biosynthesis monooxygenase [Oligoflexaceae bacterium]